MNLDPVIGSEQAKSRPCVVMQRDAANRAGRTTIVVPLADAKDRPGGIITPRLQSGEGGLRKDSIALCRQVRVVDQVRLGRRLGALSDATVSEIARGLVEILDLGEAVEADYFAGRA